MAKRLRKQGAEVTTVAMFDAPSAGYNERHNPYFDEQGAMVDDDGALRPDLVPRDASLGAGLRRHANPDSIVRSIGALAAAARRRLWTNVKARFRRVRCAAYLWMGRPLPDDLREAHVFGQIARRAQEGYTLGLLDTRIVVFRSQGLYHEDDLGWSPHSTHAVECVEVRGDHQVPRDLMREPSASQVAERLRAAIG